MSQNVLVILASCAIPLAMIGGGMLMAYESPAGYERLDIITRPEPPYDSKHSVESALRQRRSVRTYTNAPITVAEVSQLVWAGQGVTHADGLRTAPSAGALYPLTVYLVVGSVQTLSTGIYKY
jgi:hypothetical protein